MTDLSDELAVSVQVALWQAMEHLGYTPTPDAVRELRIAAIAAYEAEQWRPISEAPKDGTRVLITRSPCTGRIPYRIVWWAKGAPRGWRWRFSKVVQFAPTHYRPLPAPPVGEG